MVRVYIKKIIFSDNLDIKTLEQFFGWTEFLNILKQQNVVLEDSRFNFICVEYIKNEKS